jgi:hypothetical protein
MEKDLDRVAPFNPFFFYTGNSLPLVNSKGNRLGYITLKKNTDILSGFSQENEAGVLIFYKVADGNLTKGVLAVQEVPRLK